MKPGRFDWNLDIALRYLPIIEQIKKSKIQNPSILEIGSGSSGITPYLQLPVTGVDINFGENISDLLTPVRLSAKELPFEDRQFDFVVSVDMLEHVSADERPQFVSEMVRVAEQGVFLAVPTGRAAESQDRVLDSFYRKIHGEGYWCLIEHIENGLPAKTDVIRMIYDAARRNFREVNISMARNANIYARYIWMYMSWTNHPALNRLYIILGRYYRLFKYFNFPPAYRQIFLVKLSHSSPKKAK